MTMGPWIHGLSIMTIDCTDLDQRFLLVLEGLRQIVDVARYQVGTRWGRATPGWHRAALTCGPKWPYHVHLLHMSMFFTILAYFCHISWIQIILQA